MSKKKILISGGGTGGHVFPALAIANALKRLDADVELLFVGAKGKLEMEKVPAAGYKIIGLPVAGFQRRLSLKTVSFFFKLAASLWQARRIVRQFQPQVAVGVGGYASGPVLKMAAKRGIATVLQEQNSYAGLTNRLLAKKAAKICVAYEDMERFFPADKIILTGNPVRHDLIQLTASKTEALEHFNLASNKPVILLLGGSLGARTINQSVIKHLRKIADNTDIQVIWQCGKIYINQAQQEFDAIKPANLKLMPFISRMDLAYMAADVVVSRAGAGTISELTALGKASILVPSPNVAEDHQTKNAQALVDKQAALLLSDAQASEQLIPMAMQLLRDKEQCLQLAQNARQMAKPKADEQIASEILKLIDG